MDEIKYIRVADGDYVWSFPARLVAKHRAEYYAREDADTTYDREFAHTIDNDFELNDWFLNNMDWEDVSKFARLDKQPFKLKPNLSEATVSVFLRDL